MAWGNNQSSYLQRVVFPLNNIPRGKLVKISMLHPTLIDAAFTKFNQEYEGREEELRNTTLLRKRMPFHDQMKFKAIIDIDGNDWSSRFPKLLCTNSVIIKVWFTFSSFSLRVMIDEWFTFTYVLK